MQELLTLERTDVPYQGLDDLSSLFDSTGGFTDEEIGARFGAMFDELTEMAAQNPSDEMALTAIRSLVVEVKSRGYIDQAMQMAVVLGAAACTHSHLQELANDIGDIVTNDGDAHDGESKDAHSHDHDAEEHDSKTCRDCLAGKRCRRKG